MSRRILLVDDDVALTESLRDILEDSQYSVSVAASGALGLDEVKRLEADLVILDYHLPDGKGVEWAERFRAARPKLKIFLMTGMSESEVTLHSGIQAFIPKPIAPEILLEKIDSALKT